MSIATTVLQDAIIRLGDNNTFNTFEKRSPEFGTLQAFKDGAPLLLPKEQVTQLRTAARRPVKVASLQRYTATMHDGYTCDFNPDANTSAFTPLSWAVKGFDAAITPAVNADNYISAAEDLRWQLDQGLRTVFTFFEQAGVTFLETNKSATNAYPENQVPGSTNVGGLFTLPYLGREKIYQIQPAVFKRNLLDYGKIQDVANTEAITNFKFISMQGAGNGVNTGYQVEPGIFDEYRSNFVGDVNDDDTYETHYLFPKGSVGVYDWVPFEGRTSQTIGTGGNNAIEGWDTFVDPVLGFTWQIHWKQACVDGQYKIVYSYTLALAFARAYSSDNSVSPILKFEVGAEV